MSVLLLSSFFKCERLISFALLCSSPQLLFCSLVSSSNSLHLSSSTPSLHLHSAPSLVEFVFHFSF